MIDETSCVARPGAPHSGIESSHHIRTPQLNGVAVQWRPAGGRDDGNATQRQCDAQVGQGGLQQRPHLAVRADRGMFGEYHLVEAPVGKRTRYHFVDLSGRGAGAVEQHLIGRHGLQQVQRGDITLVRQFQVGLEVPTPPDPIDLAVVQRQQVLRAQREEYL